MATHMSGRTLSEQGRRAFIRDMNHESNMRIKSEHCNVVLDERREPRPSSAARASRAAPPPSGPTSRTRRLPPSTAWTALRRRWASCACIIRARGGPCAQEPRMLRVNPPARALPRHSGGTIPELEGMIPRGRPGNPPDPRPASVLRRLCDRGLIHDADVLQVWCHEECFHLLITWSGSEVGRYKSRER